MFQILNRNNTSHAYKLEFLRLFPHEISEYKKRKYTKMNLNLKKENLILFNRKIHNYMNFLKLILLENRNKEHDKSA